MDGVTRAQSRVARWALAADTAVYHRGGWVVIVGRLLARVVLVGVSSLVMAAGMQGRLPWLGVGVIYMGFAAAWLHGNLSD